MLNAIARRGKLEDALYFTVWIVEANASGVEF